MPCAIVLWTFGVIGGQNTTRFGQSRRPTFRTKPRNWGKNNIYLTILHRKLCISILEAPTSPELRLSPYPGRLTSISKPGWRGNFWGRGGCNKGLLLGFMCGSEVCTSEGFDYFGHDVSEVCRILRDDNQYYPR